jgi:hypothetical protein
MVGSELAQALDERFPNDPRGRDFGNALADALTGHVTSPGEAAR